MVSPGRELSRTTSCPPRIGWLFAWGTHLFSSMKKDALEVSEPAEWNNWRGLKVALSPLHHMLSFEHQQLYLQGSWEVGEGKTVGLHHLTAMPEGASVISKWQATWTGHHLAYKCIKKSYAQNIQAILTNFNCQLCCLKGWREVMLPPQRKLFTQILSGRQVNISVSCSWQH